MAWVEHIHEGRTYKFAHLEPHTVAFTRPETKEQPSDSFTVDVRYSDHCFTREPKPGERYEESQVYKNGERKVRLFYPKRYELSKTLPGLIRALPSRKPQHNGTNGNFFIVETLDHDGEPVTYVVIFSLRKSTKGRMAMLVETAFFDEPELAFRYRRAVALAFGSSLTTRNTT